MIQIPKVSDRKSVKSEIEERKNFFRKVMFITDLCFTLLELLIVISIISMLVSILLPALKNAKEASREIACKGNLKNIGTAFMLYESDYGLIPYADQRWQSIPQGVYGQIDRFWYIRIAPYLNLKDNLSYDNPYYKKTVYCCPKYDGLNPALSYCANCYPTAGNVSFSRILEPSKKMFFCDGDASVPYMSINYLPGGTYDYPVSYRHNNKANILWCDFHVGNTKQYLTVSDLYPLW